MESGHRFGRKTDIMDIKFIGKKGKYLDTIEKFYIYQETKKNNQIHDKHAVIYNRIFALILENQQVN
jgi:endo-alpha-1,4-polygalactosaminidase (GH114 family)